MLEQELLDLTPQERLLALHKQGRLIRFHWDGIDDAGRATACLYAALVPGASGTGDCPASLMPQWLANIVPYVDDRGSAAAWPAMIERFGLAVPIMGRLTPEAERRVLAKTMLAALAIARPHNPETCGPVIALWERELAGDSPALMDWRAVRWVAARWMAECWTAQAAAQAAQAAAAAAEMVEAQETAAEAACWAAQAAGWAAQAAGAAAAQEEAAEAVEAQAAWGKITDMLLTAVEAERSCA